MKLKNGYAIFEELFSGFDGIQMEEINLEQILKEHKNAAQKGSIFNIEILKDFIFGGCKYGTSV